MDEIRWSRKRRAQKADRGHTLVRIGCGRMHPSSMAYRYHFECECGTTGSGWGWDGMDAAHRKHVKRALRSE